MDTFPLWSEYVAWLKEHVPHAYENLAPGATEAQLEEVERVTGYSLPEAAKHVWRLNDGQRETMIASTRSTGTPCIPTLSFLSTTKVIEVWRTWDELRKNESPASLESLQSAGRSVFPGKVRPLYTHPAWIPLWSDPTRADYVGLDLDPDVQGTRGQIINFGRDEERHAVLADDLDALLAILLEEVRSGAWQASRMPYGKDGATIEWFGDPNGHFFNALQRRRPKTPTEQATTLLAEAKKLRAAKQPEQALARVAEARALVDLGTPMLLVEADALEDLERWRDADAVLAKLIERAPKLAQHAVRRARNLVDRLADLAGAENVVNDALTRAPDQAELKALARRIGHATKH
jgi:cell wall assembly regulator SMI1